MLYSPRSEREIEETLNLYGDCIYRIAYSRTRNKEDAEDIVQEVFLKYMNAKIAFLEEEHRKAWLIRVTLNCSNSLLRSPWIKRRGYYKEIQTCECKEDFGIYEEVLKLKKKQRILIHLFYYEDLSIKEIAKLLGCSEGSVKTGLHRARQQLQTNYKGVLE